MAGLRVGGKSVVQLMAALQYVDVPKYSAVLIRKTYADLAQPGALLDMAKDWLMPWVEKGEVKWNDKDKKFTFTSGATLKLGYLETDGDKYQYQGAVYQYIGIDECTQIIPSGYTYLFSRLRKPVDMQVPLRYRATANPGGEFHDYYYNRFFTQEARDKKRIFMGATLDDNPYLDQASYRESLSELTQLEQEQLLHGNWEAREAGGMFDRSCLIPITWNDVPISMKTVRFWDIASTDPSKQKAGKKRAKLDPDTTVGWRMGQYAGNYYITDIVSVQGDPATVDKLIYDTAIEDGHGTVVRVEKQPGAAGDFVHEHFAKLLAGYNFDSISATGSKVERARPFAVAVSKSKVFYISTIKLMSEFFSQAEAFPYASHDDYVDAGSGAFSFFKQFVVAGLPSTVGNGDSYWRRLQ